MHVQVSTIKNDVVEIAIRGNSLECNENSTRIESVRVAGRRWIVLSTNKDGIDNLIDKAKSMAEEGGIELAEAELARGDFKFEIGYFDKDDAFEILEDIKNRFGFIEAILTYEKSVREIETSDGADAREEKALIDLNVSAVGKAVASIHVGGLGGLEVIEEKFEMIVEELENRLKALESARYLNPFMRGFKFDVVLAKECACAFVHEVVHRLEADVLSSLEEGEGLTVYDTPNGFGGYYFDDEGVLAKEKCLINNGKIVSYLHTRETAYKFGDIPMGNGRGLFTIPKAFQTNLHVEEGDWTFDEMVEEIKEGFVAEGLIKAEIQNEVLYIYPEVCWYVKKGKIVCPVIVNVIKMPAREALKKIKAVGREHFERIGYEKGFAISERSPPIMVEAIVG